MERHCTGSACAQLQAPIVWILHCSPLRFSNSNGFLVCFLMQNKKTKNHWEVDERTVTDRTLLNRNDSAIEKGENSQRIPLLIDGSDSWAQLPFHGVELPPFRSLPNRSLCAVKTVFPRAFPYVLSKSRSVKKDKRKRNKLNHVSRRWWKVCFFCAFVFFKVIDWEDKGGEKRITRTNL